MADKIKKALVVGVGGIGKNVYVPQLRKLGYQVHRVDPIMQSAEYGSVNDIPKHIQYDIAVVCCPNIHHLPEVLMVSDYCKTILVEKPGFLNSGVWKRNLERPELKEHHIVLVKNNLYRSEIAMLRDLCEQEHVTKVEITWFNKNRIPNPGSWFTTKEQAFGGVTHDLFPHLYCFMYILFSLHQIEKLVPTTLQMQRWDLDSLADNTDYGAINKDGTYDVCDYAEAHYLINDIPVTLQASWKEGYDKQDITIYYKDGSTFNWSFGLCPDEAYGEMIQAVSEGNFMFGAVGNIEKRIDEWIHEQLEYFGNED